VPGMHVMRGIPGMTEMPGLLVMSGMLELIGMPGMPGMSGITGMSVMFVDTVHCSRSGHIYSRKDSCLNQQGCLQLLNLPC